jgi:hypothetical protein
MLLWMQVVREVLDCRVEQLCCHYRRDCERSNRPPQRRRMSGGKNDQHGQCRGHMHAESTFHAKRMNDSGERKSDAFVERLIFHDCLLCALPSPSSAALIVES